MDGSWESKRVVEAEEIEQPTYLLQYVWMAHGRTTPFKTTIPKLELRE
jgi:hypothetical protein